MTCGCLEKKCPTISKMFRSRQLAQDPTMTNGLRARHSKVIIGLFEDAKKDIKKLVKKDGNVADFEKELQEIINTQILNPGTIIIKNHIPKAYKYGEARANQLLTATGFIQEEK